MKDRQSLIAADDANHGNTVACKLPVLCHEVRCNSAHYAGRILRGKRTRLVGLVFCKVLHHIQHVKKQRTRLNLGVTAKFWRAYSWQESSRSCVGCVRSPNVLSGNCRHGWHSLTKPHGLTGSCVETCFDLFILWVGINLYYFCSVINRVSKLGCPKGIAKQSRPPRGSVRKRASLREPLPSYSTLPLALP